MSQVIKYKLPNGLTILLQPQENVVSISAGLWLKAGSRYETPEQYGYAHFIEHMLFKGTQKYSARDIARIVDRVGGQHNAATNREHTCYYINVISDYLEMALELLSEMFYNSLFDDNEISKEKDVVLEEMRMYEDTPDEHIHDIFMETMFHDFPLGHQILGTAENIKNISRESLINFYDQHYGTDNSLLVIVGNFDIDNAKKMIEKYYGNDKKHSEKTIIEGVLTDRIYRRHLERDLEQVHFCLGLDGIKKISDDRWPLYLLSTILGGSMSSRLFQKVREHEGLCYSVYSFHSSYQDLGVFGIYCGTSPERYKKARDLIIEECKTLVNKSISLEELNDAKTFMKGNLALSLESTEVRMGQIARNEITYNKSFGFKEIVDKINAVSLDDFVRVCESMFKNKRFTNVSIGKLKFVEQEKLVID